MIKSRFLFCCMFLLLAGQFFGLSSAAASEFPVATKQQDNSVTASMDETAIRQAADAFENAFNAGDAAAVASQWTEDGEYVNETGERYEGRASIQKEYAAFFEKYPGVKIHVDITKVKMISPGSALVEGTSTLGTEDKPATVSNQYLCVYVKQNNAWQVASAHDIRGVDNTNYGEMTDLEPMTGKWQFKNESTQVDISCRWIANKKFLERQFKVLENGTETTSGTQIIGRNPVSQQITSWLFDSNGGHDLGLWTREKQGWIIQSSGATADGTPTSSINQLSNVDANTIAWKSVNRTAGDQQLPDSAQVLLKRVSD